MSLGFAVRAVTGRSFIGRSLIGSSALRKALQKHFKGLQLGEIVTARERSLASHGSIFKWHSIRSSRSALIRSSSESSRR